MVTKLRCSCSHRSSTHPIWVSPFSENCKCLGDTEEGSPRVWEACISQAALEAALALPSGGAGREVNGKFLVRKGFFTKLLSNRSGASGDIFILGKSWALRPLAVGHPVGERAEPHCGLGETEARGMPCWSTGVWGVFQAGLESGLLMEADFTRCSEKARDDA